MIKEWTQEAFAEFMRLASVAGRNAWDNTLGLVDPIVAYSVEVAAIVLACMAVGWFFPPVRSFFGAVAVGAITWLFGFWKGEQAEKEFQKKHPPKPIKRKP